MCMRVEGTSVVFILECASDLCQSAQCQTDPKPNHHRHVEWGAAVFVTVLGTELLCDAQPAGQHRERYFKPF